jgi:hypothetical protein
MQTSRYLINIHFLEDLQLTICLLLNVSEVKKIAPEFYDSLPCHNSWSKVIFDFIFDPSIGPYARIKRSQKISAVNTQKAK